MNKIKIFLNKHFTYLYKGFIGLFLLFLSFTCGKIIVENVNNNFEYNVNVTIVEKYQNNWTIIYKTDNDIIFYKYTDPATFTESIIGEQTTLKYVEKEKLNLKEQPVAIYVLTTILFFIFGSLITINSIFYIWYYKHSRNG